MIRFLLQEIERSPNPVFAKKELLSISPEDFEELRKRKILTYFRTSRNGVETLRFPRCQHGCPLTVVSVDGELEAVCLEHPGEDPITIEKGDLDRYTFSVDMLLMQIRVANRIDGRLSRISGGYFYLGYKTYNTGRVGFIFIPRIGDEGLIKLSGLRHICREDDVLVALTPDSTVEDLILKGRLSHDRIAQKSLTSSLNPETFELPIEELISGLLEPKAGKEVPITELSEKQREDYEQFEYQCYDKIDIPGTIPMGRSNFIMVNENKVRIGDSLFILLLRFVVELKKNAGGWVNVQDFKSEGIITSNGYQAYGRLRTALVGSLTDRDGQRFIQNDKARNYRISTHPDFITYNKEKLQSHQDYRIRKLVEQLL